MPCDSITTSEIALGKLDAGLLDAAMIALGFAGKYVYNRESGKITINGQRWQAAPTDAQIKQAYSAQVVQATAKKYGWQLKKTGQFTYEAIKR